MADLPRKKSPRAPSIALDEAIDRAMKAYEKERLHPAPTEVVAQNLGYKGMSSGSALGAMASLRYYGLLDRPREGFLAVSKDVEAYKFSPSEELRHSFLVGFLRRPPLFAELLDKYASGLPSDANLKYELIQRGFLPATAGSFVVIFKRSVEFAHFYDYEHNDIQPSAIDFVADASVMDSPKLPDSLDSTDILNNISAPSKAVAKNAFVPFVEEAEHDRIPVRLPGGRRAWLSIPTPFFAADKQRIKAQVDLLLTEDEENDL